MGLFMKGSNEKKDEILANMETAAANFKDKIMFVWIDADNEQEYGLILDSFEVSRDMLPAKRVVKIAAEEGEDDALTRFEPENNDLSAEAITTFVQAVIDGKIEGQAVKSTDEDDFEAHDEL